MSRKMYTNFASIKLNADVFIDENDFSYSLLARLSIIFFVIARQMSALHDSDDSVCFRPGFPALFYMISDYS